jgi:hypothetical protein
MATYPNDEYKFPDEIDNDTNVDISVEDDGSIEIEIEDDTPEEDRGRTPVSQEVVRQLEVETDELDKYSKDAKDKLIKMKRVWHDERRAKEEAYREQQEAINMAKQLMNENQRMKAMIQNGSQEYAKTIQNSAHLELKMAQRAYKDARDMGDTDAEMEANQAMQAANLRLVQANNLRMPTLPEEQFVVQTPQEQVQPQQRPDNRAMNWQERNSWFGQDEEMTAAALGLHEKLKRQGVQVGSDEYYATLDRTIRRRFSENFESPEKAESDPVARTRPSMVVAPATRSTSSKKIKLKQSQLAISKKLGLTPEQYALEFRKLENKNG